MGREMEHQSHTKASEHREPVLGSNGQLQKVVRHGREWAVDGTQQVRRTMEDIGTHWGNIRVILGLYGDNGKEDGNYYNGIYKSQYSVNPVVLMQ